VTFLSVWMRRPEVSATLDEINVSQNKIGVDGAKALASVIPESSLKWIVIGSKSTRVPVHNLEVTSLDVSGQNLGPVEITVLAAAISTNAALANLTVSLGAQKLVFMYEGDEVHGSLPHGGEQPSARGGDGSGFGGGAVHVHSMTVELAERCLAATSHPIVPDDDDDVDATARGGDQLPAPAGGGGCSSDVGGAGGSDDCAFPERESCSCSWSFPMYHLRVVIIMIRTLDRLRLTYVLRYRF
jgi:hypothetical protein